MTQTYVSTHSRPKAAGLVELLNPLKLLFQLTAARRRLGIPIGFCLSVTGVSTHSRPKAAGFSRKDYPLHPRCFNSQPPEGGW